MPAYTPPARPGGLSTSAKKSGGCTGGRCQKDRFHRGLHVVVDAAPADPAIELERLIVSVEHQFLGLAEIGMHERHAAVR